MSINPNDPVFDKCAHHTRSGKYCGKIRYGHDYMNHSRHRFVEPPKRDAYDTLLESAQALVAWDSSDDDPELISRACSAAREALRMINGYDSGKAHPLSDGALSS